jgi:hypothetical protein
LLARVLINASRVNGAGKLRLVLNVSILKQIKKNMAEEITAIQTAMMIVIVVDFNILANVWLYGYVSRPHRSESKHKTITAY